MAGRSIGEALAELRKEFPDVTVSKIRFLESQGLVCPARSASGYRQFSDEDVARLSWVLLQQRKHYLPLKVIRRRLRDEPAPWESEAPSSDPEEMAGDELPVAEAAGEPQPSTELPTPPASTSSASTS